MSAELWLFNVSSLTCAIHCWRVSAMGKRDGVLAKSILPENQSGGRILPFVLKTKNYFNNRASKRNIRKRGKDPNRPKVNYSHDHWHGSAVTSESWKDYPPLAPNETTHTRSFAKRMSLEEIMATIRQLGENKRTVDRSPLDQSGGGFGGFGKALKLADLALNPSRLSRVTRQATDSALRGAIQSLNANDIGGVSKRATDKALRGVIQSLDNTDIESVSRRASDKALSGVFQSLNANSDDIERTTQDLVTAATVGGLKGLGRGIRRTAKETVYDPLFSGIAKLKSGVLQRGKRLKGFFARQKGAGKQRRKRRVSRRRQRGYGLEYLYYDHQPTVRQY